MGSYPTDSASKQHPYGVRALPVGHRRKPSLSTSPVDEFLDLRFKMHTQPVKKKLTACEPSHHHR